MSTTDNFIQPFFLAGAGLRGVLVRAGRVSDDTITPHRYPPVVADLVARSLTLGIALSSTLKYDGLFTLQIRGDGPVRAVVADVTSAGMVRGIARYDADAFSGASGGELSGASGSELSGASGGELSGASAGALPAREHPPLSALTGAGVLSFTVDQGPDMTPYQGIVALEGSSLVESALTYLHRSEQIPTRLALASRYDATGAEARGWRTGALLVQKMPGAGAGAGMGTAEGEADDDDAWTTATMLMRTLTDDELVDPELSGEDLLFRLFHQQDLRLGVVRPVFYGCRCSREKVLRALAGLPQADRDHLEEQGSLEVVCDFCGVAHRVTSDDLAVYLSSLT